MSGGNINVRTHLGLGLLVLAACAGCDSLADPVEEQTGPRLVIPTDIRPAMHATRMPPPIAGGTLLVTRGQLAVASDPERDAIVIANPSTGELLANIQLQSGDEPGRLVEDAVGRVHVALRRGGAVLTLDPVGRTILSRRAVCGAPRGLALSSPETLVIACADGKLVSLPTAGGEPTRVLNLEPDLRDVVVTPTGLAVSRFKSTELLRVDQATGAVTRRDKAPEVQGTRMIPDPSTEAHPEFGSVMQVSDAFKPVVAWRTLAGLNGTTVVIHQRAVDAEVELSPPQQSANAYGGGGGGCDSISQNAATIFGSDGSVTNLTLRSAPLPVDAVMLPDGNILIASAGPLDATMPRPFFVFDGTQEDGIAIPGGNGGGFAPSTVALLSVSYPTSGSVPIEGTVAGDPGCTSMGALDIQDPAVAVAYNPMQPAQVVVQTTQPSSLVVFDDISRNPSRSRTISFDDGTTLDTGFQMFHRDSGAGLACATCHAEGSEDGNVWRFTEIGERRTQSLEAGLEGTAPFHWDGKLANVGALMTEVFVGRMGGINESEPRLASFQDFVFSFKAPVPVRDLSDEAAQRGSRLFVSSGCTTCHSGEHLTNNKTVNVGTSKVGLQVPSLIGISHRPPYMHNGCAKTLFDRFDPACGGGDQHGSTSQLGTAEVADLVAYLETL